MPLGSERCLREAGVRDDPFVTPSEIRRIGCSTSFLAAKHRPRTGNFYETSTSEFKSATYIHRHRKNQMLRYGVVNYASNLLRFILILRLLRRTYDASCASCDISCLITLKVNIG